MIWNGKHTTPMMQSICFDCGEYLSEWRLKNSFENLKQRWVSQMKSGLEQVGRPTARQRFVNLFCHRLTPTCDINLQSILVTFQPKSAWLENVNLFLWDQPSFSNKQNVTKKPQVTLLAGGKGVLVRCTAENPRINHNVATQKVVRTHCKWTPT